MTANSGARVLLDTCAVLWLGGGERLADPAVAAIERAGRNGGILVSPVSAWEIGLLSRPKRPQPLRLQPDARTWFARFMSGVGITLAPFSADIAIGSSYLPGELHSDPADRLLVATARHLGIPMVTRDQPIIDYAAAGFLEVVAC